MVPSHRAGQAGERSACGLLLLGHQLTEHPGVLASLRHHVPLASHRRQEVQVRPPSACTDQEPLASEAPHAQRRSRPLTDPTLRVMRDGPPPQLKEQLVHMHVLHRRVSRQQWRRTAAQRACGCLRTSGTLSGGSARARIPLGLPPDRSTMHQIARVPNSTQRSSLAHSPSRRPATTRPTVTRSLVQASSMSLVDGQATR